MQCLTVVCVCAHIYHIDACKKLAFDKWLEFVLSISQLSLSSTGDSGNASLRTTTSTAARMQKTQYNKVGTENNTPNCKN